MAPKPRRDFSGLGAAAPCLDTLALNPEKPSLLNFLPSWVTMNFSKKIFYPCNKSKKNNTLYIVYQSRKINNFLFLVPGWWNWQTHHLEGVGGHKPVRVQVPLPAPFLPLFSHYEEHQFSYHSPSEEGRSRKQSELNSRRLLIGYSLLW